MACVEAESRELAWAVHNAVHAEAEEQATMINSLLIDSGWHHCLLDKKNESETDSWSDTDEESGRDDDF